MRARVSKIVKEWSHPGRWPVGWVELECGHTGRLELVDQARSAHDPENQRTKAGDELECASCDHQRASLAKLAATDPGAISHSRFRHRDSRGFGPGSHYVYARDDKSPTGCHLLLTLDDTPEAVEAIRRATGTSSLSPTERR